jgi:hypothetical protein
MSKQILIVLGILLVFGCADVSKENQLQTGCSEGSESTPENVYVAPAPNPAPTPTVICTGTFSSGWPQQFGSCSNETGNDIVVDTSGNVYITGNTSGDLDNFTNLGSSDVFVVKYNSSGNKQWLKQFGTTSGDSGNAIALDSSGNIYVFGAQNGEPFLKKLDNAGTDQWIINTPKSTYGYSNDLAVDQNNGDIYLTGSHYGDFDDQTNSGVSYDVYIVKYNSSGIKQWSRLYGSAYGDGAGGVATDSAGNIYLTGSYNGMPSDNRENIFIVQYNSDGTKGWESILDGETCSSDADHGNAITVDSSNNIFVTGQTGAGTHLDCGLNGNTGFGRLDAFVTKYNSTGSRQWTKQIGSNYNDFGHSITTDISGNVYITGYTFGDINGSSGVNHSGDVITVKYNSDGDKQWSKQFSTGSTKREEGAGISVDSSGNTYVVGYTSGEIDGNTNLGNNDVFILKYDTNGNLQ